MSRFTALTLFPHVFNEALLESGVVSRAVKEGLIQFDTVHLRDFATDARRQVDDHPVGGGDGMVLRADIAEKALISVLEPHSYVIHLTPTGKVFCHETAKRLAKLPHLIFLCGRYAGFDERFTQTYAHAHISLGDFVLSGGELPALCVMDAVARFLPGVLGNKESALEDSFEDGFLEPPQYAKPQVACGKEIPEVLLSGHHKRIARYRRRQQLLRTVERRPDLVLQGWDHLSAPDQAMAKKFMSQGADSRFLDSRS